MGKGIKIQWQVFVNEFIASGDHIGAYCKAYPGTSRKVASNKGKDLLRRPDISKIIEESNNRKQTLINQARDQEIINAAKNRTLSEVEVDGILCDIINGKSEVEKVMIIRNVVVKVKVKPDHSEKIQAIDKYYRRFGSYAPEKHQTIPDPLASKTTQELQDLLESKQKLLNDN